jgi:hypothetical protein
VSVDPPRRPHRPPTVDTDAMRTRVPHRSDRRPATVAAALFALLALLLGACAGSGATSAAVPSEPTAAPTTTAPTPEVPARSPLAELISPAGTADALSVPADPTPVGLRFEEIRVREAPILAVGIEPNGEMELPGASEIGWYRYGPTPGADGSAVLAAHVAYNGRDGVFRWLTDASPGDVFEVVYDDGSTRAFEVVELRQYDKDELPIDELFERDGDPRLALITCGGDFNPSLRSYTDNIVAYAVPTGSA